SVEVAKRNIDLAQQALVQAEDRFKNGVTGNVEVVLAAQAVAAANENYIASLFSHNFSKLALLKAMGLAERGVRQYLDTNTGGKEAPGHTSPSPSPRSGPPPPQAALRWLLAQPPRRPLPPGPMPQKRLGGAASRRARASSWPSSPSSPSSAASSGGSTRAAT